MPKSSEREQLSALIGLEVLLEGIVFDTHDLRRLPYSQALITRVLRSLQQSGVLQRVNTGKYLFTDNFSGVVKERILGKTPRNGLMEFPAMTVFDMCGIECWTEADLENFTQRLKQHWSGLVVKGDMIEGRACFEFNLCSRVDCPHARGSNMGTLCHGRRTAKCV